MRAICRVLGSVAALVTVLGFGPLQPPDAAAEGLEVLRRPPDRKTFTDAQIASGFFEVAFGAEMGFRSGANRIRKYVKPVRVFIDNQASPDRRPALRAVVADIQARVAHLDIAVTERRQDANVVVRLVRDKDIDAVIRNLYGKRGDKIVKSLEPQCLSGFSRDSQHRIVRSEVILAVDAGEFVFLDCAYEELLQSLGPIQDARSNRWTMFNDDVQKGYFGVYDQYLLNILYHPRIKPGMTARQVRRLLPQIMPDVRAVVARNNKLATPRRARGSKQPRRKGGH